METSPKITRLVIAEGAPRVPTGAVQFSDDWPGLFVRGDNAFALLLELKQILETLDAHEELNCPTYLVREIAQIIEQDVLLSPEA